MKKVLLGLGLCLGFVALTAASNGEWLRDANVKILGVLKLGSAPTTISDSTGKILSAALNTVAVAQGGTGSTTALAAQAALCNTSETALTAHAGGTQAAALALTQSKCMHVVSTVGSASDSVALPVPAVGEVHVVANEAASNALKLYGVSPVTINGVATATGVTLSAAKVTVCRAVSTSDYLCSGPN